MTRPEKHLNENYYY